MTLRDSHSIYDFLQVDDAITQELKKITAIIRIKISNHRNKSHHCKKTPHPGNKIRKSENTWI